MYAANQPSASPVTLLILLCGLAAAGLPAHTLRSQDVPRPSPEDLLVDGEFLTACGPIACFVAVKSLGGDVTLNEMVEACHWRKGQLTTLAAMRDALENTRTVTCSAVQLAPETLSNLVADGQHVAILPIRKTSQETDHVVCVVRANEGHFYVMDYPQLGTWWTEAKLVERWDGAALIVSRRQFAWSTVPWWSVILLALAGGLLLVLGRRRRSSATTKAAAQTAVLAALLASCLQVVMPCAADQPKEVIRSASPPAAASTQAYSFGAVDESAVFEHTFRIKNESSRELKIISNRVTCACISIEKVPASVKPGGAGEVVVRLLTHGKRGNVQERAIIETDDPKRQYFAFSIKAVVRGVWTDPNRIDFGTLSNGAQATKEFFVVVAERPDIEFKTAKSTDDHVLVTTGPARSDAETRLQQITAIQRISASIITSDLPPGPFVSLLEVRTSAEESPLQVPVTAYITGRFTLRPARLAWAFCYAGTKVERTCVLSPTETQGEQINPDSIRLSANHEFMSLALKRKPGDKGYELQARLTAPATQVKNELIRGDVVGTLEGQKIFSVPYTAYLSPPKARNEATQGSQ